MNIPADRQQFASVVMPLMQRLALQQQQRDQTQAKLNSIHMDDILWKHATNPFPDAIQGLQQMGQMAQEILPTAMMFM